MYSNPPSTRRPGTGFSQLRPLIASNDRRRMRSSHPSQSLALLAAYAATLLCVSVNAFSKVILIPLHTLVESVRFAPGGISLPAGERERVINLVARLPGDPNCFTGDGLVSAYSFAGEGSETVRRKLSSQRAEYVVLLLRNHGFPNYSIRVQDANKSSDASSEARVEIAIHALGPTASDQSTCRTSASSVTLSAISR